MTNTPPAGNSPSGIPPIEGIDDLTGVGRGGTATVYRGRQRGLNRVVAVKVLDRHLESDSERQRFERECMALGALSAHPNIVDVHATGVTADGRPYLVMEYLPASVADRLFDDGPMGWRPAVALITTVAEAVHAAHEAGVLHRDIKPENILLTPAGVPKLSDFGLARFTNGVSASETRTVRASLTHAAPELIEAAPVTRATDVYSLASTLHHLITGAPPFTRPDDETIVAPISRILREPPPPLAPFGVPQEVERVIARGMAKDPAARQQSARELSAELAAAADQVDRPTEADPVVPPPVGAITMELRTIEAEQRRHAGRIAALVLAVVAALVAAIVIAARARDSGDDAAADSSAPADATAAPAASDVPTTFAGPASTVDPAATTTVDPAATTTVVDTSTTAAETTTVAPSTSAATPAFAYGSGGCPDLDGSGDVPDELEPPQQCIDEESEYAAEVNTDHGTFLIELDAESAPGNVNHVVTLARWGYYDGTRCSRVIEDFLVECGRDDSDDGSSLEYTIADELPDEGEYEEGVVAISNAGEPNTGGAQFFIVVGDAGTELPPNYTIIGRVVEGYDVVEEIEELADPDADDGIPPLEDVVIESVVIIEDGERPAEEPDDGPDATDAPPPPPAQTTSPPPPPPTTGPPQESTTSTVPGPTTSAAGPTTAPPTTAPPPP